MPKLNPIDQQVVVITGGSSGIGLATAKLAAARGAQVVIAARTRAALEQAVDEINAAGPGRASFVEADVVDHAAHERIAAHAIERHGRIDSWINNAGVFVFGKVEELEEADMRQLFDINFWGMVHGSLVAAAQLRGAGGALINVGSIESDRAFPLHGIYAASKHAVKGFTDALRVELEEEGAPISVTLIKPGAIATPLPEHARSYTGTQPIMPPPLYTPEEVARTILAAAERPVREVAVGGSSRLGSIAAGLAPRTLDWLSEKLLVGGQISDRPADGDNLYAGKSEARVWGDHGGRTGRPSLYSAASRNPVATLAIVGGVAAGAFLLARRRSEPLVQGEEEIRVDPPLEGV